jgi:hypothetical protein
MKFHATRIAALLAVFAAFYFFTPPQLPLCGFRWLTGRPCPLCGLTRAMFALAKGQWREAMAFHALSPVAALMLIGLLWNRPSWSRAWLPCVVAFGVYGVLRFFVG